ncbi:Os08g0389700 [Oryza sativa Japonica Group]|uniref:Os08g0389700 protein n=1 Tax=Oryza sativa subsp. japonica TaxID=39947 RepID=B7EXL9_ORYSJ|nr:hypothetical protein EE612_044021 [Oryza sativa]BAG97116.1 unnamed protein product [Oryza sativa Japonica Group]BAT05280.1 Os08g0389700 [Oryza sativa Japonica Group]
MARPRRRRRGRLRGRRSRRRRQGVHVRRRGGGAGGGGLHEESRQLSVERRGLLSPRVAAFGSVGGVGGGGIFVPMLTLIIGFDAKSSTAISKFIVSTQQCNQYHPYWYH